MNNRWTGGQADSYKHPPPPPYIVLGISKLGGTTTLKQLILDLHYMIKDSQIKMSSCASFKKEQKSILEEI